MYSPRRAQSVKSCPISTSAPESRWNNPARGAYISCMSRLPPVKEMQRAYLASNAEYDGLFFLGVRTTGIFCRPTCRARKPLPRNVEYFATPEEAIAAGYRACKRCRPTDADDSPPWASRLLAEIETSPTTRITDADLKARGIDPATVRRHFTRKYGMSFQAYTRSRRLSEAHRSIRENGSVDAAVMESGYDSHSGFRDAFAKLFGDTPARSGDCVRLAWLKSQLGPLVVGSTSDGVCLLEFSDPDRLAEQTASLRRTFRQPLVPGRSDHLKLLEEELSRYFDGRLRKFTVPLVYPGTPFQEKVWKALLTIPFGEVRSYRDIAVKVGDSNAARAVGTANGRNRIAIVIPCHRVVNNDGQLGGYGGGLHRKRYLLNLEGVNV